MSKHDFQLDFAKCENDACFCLRTSADGVSVIRLYSDGRRRPRRVDGAQRRQPPAPRPMPPPPPSFSGAAAIHTALAVSRVRSTRNPISNCFTERSSQVRSVAKASV